MSILVDKETRLIVQGITGRDGAFHTKQMLAYGTQVVGGVTPGKGGQTTEDGLPVFDSLHEACAATHANATVIYVPAQFAAAAVKEAADARIPLIVCITEGIPVLDMVEVYHHVRAQGCRLIGPNCPGVISPEKAKIGIMPGQIHKPGRIGVISRSGTLTYEIVNSLTERGIGQSTCIGVGGDPVIGSGFRDLLPLFEADDETDAVVLVGEIGGDEEERTAEYIGEHMTKPVFAYIVGQTAPEGKRMGHAGAIVSGGAGTAESKITALGAVGVPVARTLAEVAEMVAEKMSEK